IHDESSGSGCAKWRQARNRSLKHQWSSTGVRTRARRLRQSNCYYTGERLRVGLELLDEEAVGAPVGTPVQPPQIVTGNILAILRKLHARAPMRTRMPARNCPQHRPPRKEREARKA